MAGPRRTTDAARSDMHDALADGRQRRGGTPARPTTGPQALLALQRYAGNSAVSALMTARLKWPGEQATSDIDGALRELRRDEPVIDTVEKGLKAAQAAGVPVELEGPKPPPSSLAVKTTGFGPDAVAPKKPVPPPKPVAAKHPLGKAGARAPHPGGSAAGARPAPMPAGAGAAAPTTVAAPLSADKLLQPPAPPTHVRPEDDPHFTRVTKSVAGFASAKKSHAPAHAKATEAQEAAVPPTDDVAGQAKVAKVDSMDAQQPGSFDKKAFIAAVKAAIEAKSPKNLKEAADYKESGKAGEVKGDIKGLVGQGKDGQAKDVESATAAAPDQSKAVPKPVTPMSEEQPGQPVSIPADGAVPKPAPPEQVNLAAGKHETDQQMAEGGVTDQQLAESNEPQFQQALGDKQTAAVHADTAPAQYRQQEQQVIGQGKADATAQTTAGVAGMQGSKAAAIAHLVAHKGATKSKDEAKRAEVTGRIQAIFTATEADVKKILDGIDPKVEAAFEAGEKDARTAFESYVAAKMAAYKEDRYSGWLGGLRWAKDKLFGMPDKVNEFFTAGRELYLQRMDGVISKVADIVGGDLTAAKQRIARGKTDITTYVKSLPKDLQKVGAQATKEIGDRFEQLENDVNSKQESVVDTLATKYVDARKGLDERIEELQAENKGLVDKAISAIKAVVGTIRDLVNMLTNVLARVASVVGDIVKHPVRFLGNLIDGIKGGILKFKDNILDHLRKGLMGWLFGALSSAGVELPDTFDLKGVIRLLGSIFGLTWANIRNRIVKKIGEKAMGVAEKGVGIFQTIATQGIGGLWQMFVEKLGDIKEMILEQAKDFVVTKIITAGITWLIGLLNPAAAFIKACKLIYDIVMFFVDNAERIAKFVNTILDSVADIVRGNISSVVNKIEDVLGQMVPIIIGFLASVIGLGGIGEKIRSIIHALQKPVNKALDFIVSTGLKLAGPLIRGIAGISGKVKAKVAAGKAWAKGKVEAGKTYVKGKVEAGKAWVGSKIPGRGKPAPLDTPEAKESRLKAAVREVEALTGSRQRLSLLLSMRLGQIRRKYGMTELTAVREGSLNAWDVTARINPEAKFQLFSIKDDALELRTTIGAALASLPKNAQIGAVQRLCDAKAKGMLAPGATLTWAQMRDCWVLYLDRKGHKMPRTAVGMFTKATEYKEIGRQEDQTLYHNSEGQEYVRDAIAQYVPRLIVRNITAQDLKTIKRKQGIQPTGGPGTKRRIWEHVTGQKPSPYTSTTKQLTGEIVNPQGKQIGQHGRVRIDLLNISPKAIYDLTTRKGQDTWELSDPDTPIKRQALEDVVRTQEVLIKGTIPPNAIELMD